MIGDNSIILLLQQGIGISGGAATVVKILTTTHLIIMAQMDSLNLHPFNCCTHSQ